jgi:hypothetical protein
LSIKNKTWLNDIGNPINELTIVQYGMSMNFYNTPGGAGIMKVLELSKKVLEAILRPLQYRAYHVVR